MVFGPDSLLHEAGRARPAPDGRFRIEGLKPGTYRVLPRGRQGSVVPSEPPYRTIRLEPEGATGADFTLKE